MPNTRKKPTQKPIPEKELREQLQSQLEFIKELLASDDPALRNPAINIYITINQIQHNIENKGNYVGGNVKGENLQADHSHLNAAIDTENSCQTVNSSILK